jgi:hypothetical protein
MSQLEQLTYTPLESVTVAGPSPIVDVSGFSAVGGPIAQLTINGSASVQIQCAIDQSNWVTLSLVTQSDLYILDPRGMYYRFNVTGVSGDVTVVVGPGVLNDGRLAGVRGITVRSLGSV